MTRLASRRLPRNSIYRLAFLTAASFLLTGACGLFNANSRFDQELSTVDRAVETGRGDVALKKLAALRKKAATASQWLSIAKRERSLSAWDDAVKTMVIARFKMPANDLILAVFVDTLNLAGQTQEAISRSEGLIGTSYALQGAAIRLNGSREEREPVWWEIGADFTNDPAFRRNAAIWHAVKGNLPAACAAANIPGREKTIHDRLLLALLYYDAGFPELCLKTLEYETIALDAGFRSDDALKLMADASIEAGNAFDAIPYWEALLESTFSGSPVPWYNLAVSSSDPRASHAYLNDLLDRYPAYFPAISRLVASYLAAVTPPEKDSLTRELESRGFLSLSMKESEKLFHPAREAVTERLNAAIASTAGAPDIRFFIEESKVQERDSMDIAVSASRIWKLLERYSSNDLLVRYAMWFFLRKGQAETAFSLNKDRAGPSDPFYDALEAASKGDLAAAEAAFNRCAASKEDSWAALANIAAIRERSGDLAGAVDFYNRATSFAPNPAAASDLQYDSAMLLSRSRDTRRAQQVLMRSLELDPKNERSSAALRRLRGF